MIRLYYCHDSSFCLVGLIGEYPGYLRISQLKRMKKYQ